MKLLRLCGFISIGSWRDWSGKLLCTFWGKFFFLIILGDVTPQLHWRLLIMRGQNEFQNERRTRKKGNTIFSRDKQKVRTIPFPVCVSTSVRRSVMDSISPDSQELRGPPPHPPRCFKECLICLCSSASHTSSPLPARQVEWNDESHVSHRRAAATVAPAWETHFDFWFCHL